MTTVPDRGRSRATASGRRSRAPRGACSTSAGEAFGFDIAWSDIAAGGNAIDAYGVAIRPEDVTRAGEGDAILLGAVGGPRWDDPTATVRPEQACSRSAAGSSCSPTSGR